MNIVVVGAGTVGVMSVLHFLYYSKHKITCIHSSTKDILGIGESSNVQLPDLLWKSIQLNPYNEKDLELSFKYGVKYQNWREKDFFSPIIPNEYAIHFDNFRLAKVCFEKCKKIYKERFEEKDIVVNDIDSLKKDYDFIIDCRGYPDDYSDYYMSELPLNHCLVKAIPEKGSFDFTYHYAHRNGWMFGIPLKTRQGWGYLFNDRLTSIDDAVENISEIFNEKTEYSNLREFKFKPYRCKTFLKDNILKNGNRAIFYEPLEALSGVFYDKINRTSFDYLCGNRSEDQVNVEINQAALQYERFIAFVYHGGSIYNSAFWQDAVKRCKNIIGDYDFSKNLKHKDVWPFQYPAWKILNDGLEYKYI